MESNREDIPKDKLLEACENERNRLVEIIKKSKGEQAAEATIKLLALDRLLIKLKSPLTNVAADNIFLQLEEIHEFNKLNTARVPQEIDEVLDFSGIPSSKLKEKVINRNGKLILTHSLDEVEPTTQAVDRMNSLSSKIDTWFLSSLSNDQYNTLLTTLSENNAAESTNNICKIHDNGAFTLEPWARELFPLNTHNDIENFIQGLCELSFSAIFKNNGEYKDDFIDYMDNFEKISFPKETSKEEIADYQRQLLNSAAQGLAVPFAKNHLTSQEQVQLFGGLTAAVLRVQKPYAENQLKAINDFSKKPADAKTIASVKAKHAKMQIDLEKILVAELKNLRKYFQDFQKKESRYKNLTNEIKFLDNLLKKDMTEITKQLIETRLDDRYVMYNQEYQKIKQLINNTYNIQNLNVSFHDKKEITNQEVDQLEKSFKEFQSFKTVTDLKKECADYQKYLENMVKTELKNVLKALNKDVTKFDALPRAKKIMKVESEYRQELDQQISKVSSILNSRDINKMVTLCREQVDKERQKNQYRMIKESKPGLEEHEEDKLIDKVNNVQDKRVTQLIDNKRLMLTIDKLYAVKTLTDCFTKPETTPYSKQVINFNNTFTTELQDTLTKLADSRTEMFLNAIRIILGAASLGIHSKITRGTFKFWQSHDKVSTERMAEKLEYTLGKKNKK